MRISKRNTIFFVVLFLLGIGAANLGTFIHHHQEVEQTLSTEDCNICKYSFQENLFLVDGQQYIIQDPINYEDRDIISNKHLYNQTTLFYYQNKAPPFVI